MVAELPPARKARIHERLELFAVIVNLKMGQFMDNYVLHEFAWLAGQHLCIGDLAFGEVANAPKGLHAAEFP